MELTVLEFAQKLDLKPIAGESGFGNTVKSMYFGDLLSWVMGRAKENDAWVTILGHVNIVAVAVLAAVGCVVVCEAADVSVQAIEKADAEGVPILTSPLGAFELAKKYIHLE